MNCDFRLDCDKKNKTVRNSRWSVDEKGREWILNRVWFKCCCCLVASVVSDSVRPHRRQAAHEAPPPWDSPGKNTGVGCHFLLQCRKVKSESEDAQSCPTLIANRYVFQRPRDEKEASLWKVLILTYLSLCSRKQYFRSTYSSFRSVMNMCLFTYSSIYWTCLWQHVRDCIEKDKVNRIEQAFDLKQPIIHCNICKVMLCDQP